MGGGVKLDVATIFMGVRRILDRRREVSFPGCPSNIGGFGDGVSVQSDL
jgi:hypothetical protein